MLPQTILITTVGMIALVVIIIDAILTRKKASKRHCRYTR